METSPPATTQPRGGYAKGDARREAIVEVATEVFGTLGYRAATMLQIAAACGISRTGLLHYFPTKESLLEAVLARRDRTNSSLIPESRASENDLAGLRRLIAVTQHNATSPEIVNLFSVLSAEAGDPDHPAHAYFVARYARLRSDLEGSLTSLAARGALVAGTDPRSLAIDIIALMDGLQVQWVLSPEQVDMPSVLRHRLRSALVDPTGLD